MRGDVGQDDPAVLSGRHERASAPHEPGGVHGARMAADDADGGLRPRRLPRGDQAVARLVAVLLPQPGKPEQQRDVGLPVHLVARRRGERDRSRVLGLSLGIALAQPGQHGERRDDDDRQQEPGGDGRDEPVAAPVAQPVLLGLPASPPFEDRMREGIVVDLVAPAADRLQDPRLARESLEHRSDHGLVDARQLGEIGRPQRDLRPRRRDELAQDAGRDRLLGRRQRRDRVVDVLGDDALGATQLLERAQPQSARAGGALVVPQVHEDDLEIRRLDARLGGLHAVEHRFHERRLDLHRLALRGLLPVPQRERLEDRRARRGAVEMLDAHEVVEQARHVRGEGVELRQRVLADRDEHARGRVAPREQAGELRDERPVGVVVEEVLLELVEDHEQGAVDAQGGGGDGVGERAAFGQTLAELRRQVAERGPDRALQPGQRILRPRAEVQGGVFGRLAVGDPPAAFVAHLAHDAGAQQRALADAARPEEDRDAVGEQIVEHDRARRVTTEEVGGVGLGVRDQALVRAAPCLPAGGFGGGGRGRAQVRGRLIASTQSSSRASRISTRWRCQNFSSIGSGSRSIAHDPNRRACWDQM